MCKLHCDFNFILHDRGSKLFSLRFKVDNNATTSDSARADNADLQSLRSPQKKVSVILLAVFCIFLLIPLLFLTERKKGKQRSYRQHCAGECKFFCFFLTNTSFAF